MTRSLSRHKRAALRAIGPGLLVAISIGLSGCFYMGDGEGGPPIAFCGILYACGSDSDPNRGGSQTATGTSSNSSSSSTSSTGSATPTGGQ
jgi:hypothetical protein